MIFWKNTNTQIRNRFVVVRSLRVVNVCMVGVYVSGR